MNLNLQALLHNKPVLIGAGVATVAGLYVLVRRKQTTGSTSSQPDNSTSGGSTGYTFPNTSGTDIASWLGSQESSIAQQQADFIRQLQDAGVGTGQIPPTPPTGTVTPPAPIGAGPAVSRTTITGGESLAPVLAFFGMTQQQFEALNPGIQSTYYKKPGTGALAFSLPSPRIVNVAGDKGF
jgi:hypothetical protein